MIGRRTFLLQLGAATLCRQPWATISRLNSGSFLLAERPDTQSPSISPSSCRVAALTVNAISTLNDVNSSQHVFVTDALNTFIAEHPRASRKEVIRAASVLRDQVTNKLLANNQSFTTVFDAASQTSLAIAKTKLISPEGLYKSATKLYGDFPTLAQPEEQIWEFLDVQTILSNSFTRFSNYQSDALSRGYKNAISHGDAFDHLLKDVTGGISTADSIQSIVARIPNIDADSPLARALINASTGSITLTDCQNLLSKAATPVTQYLTKGIDLLNTVKSLQGNIVDDLKQLSTQTLNDVSDYVKSAESSANALISSGQLAGAIADLISPGFGARLTSYTNAVISVANTVKSILSTASKFGTLSQIGTSLLSGGLTAGLTGFMSAFGGGGGGGDTALLKDIQQQLTEIKADIDNLKTTMNVRFDQLDRNLARYYTALSTQLSQIQETSNIILVDVEGIKQQMFDVQADLQQVVGESRADFVATINQELIFEVGQCLGTDGISMSTDLFKNHCLNLRTFATLSASRPGTNGPTSEPSYALANVLTEMRGPVSANIGYLSSFLVKNRIRSTPLSAQPLANYDMWSTAARANIQLLVEQSSLVAQTPQVIDLLRQVRETGAQTALAINDVTKKDGDSLKRCNAIFQWLFQSYRDGLSLLRQAISDDYAEFKQTLNSQQAEIQSVDLFGSADQVTAFDPVFHSVQPDALFGDEGDVDVAPVGAITSTAGIRAPNSYRLYSLLKNLPLEITYGDLEWGRLKRECHTWNDPDNPLRWIFTHDAEQVQVGTYFRTGQYVFDGPAYFSDYVSDAHVYRFITSSFNPPESDPPCNRDNGTLDRQVDLETWFKSNWNGGSGWTQFPPSPVGSTEGDSLPQYTSMMTEINGKLKDAASAFAKTKLVQSLNGGRIRNVTILLDSILSLVRAYCALGLSSTLERDDEMRALLYGSTPVVGSVEAGQAIAEIGTRVDKNEYDSSVLNIVNERAEHRIASLEDRVDAALRRVWNGSTQESIRTVSSTLSLIDSYIAAYGVASRA
jgi:hypothetical protein